jgi:hypothetical protein
LHRLARANGLFGATNVDGHGLHLGLLEADGVVSSEAPQGAKPDARGKCKSRNGGDQKT